MYLARDLKAPQVWSMTGSKLLSFTQAPTKGANKFVVLKIFEGVSQQRFFHKESQSLNKIKQCFKGQTFPGIVHMIEAQVLITEASVLE